MVLELRRFRSFFNGTKETNMPEMLGTGKGGLDREYNGEENNTRIEEGGEIFETKGVFNEWERIQRLPDPEKGEQYCSKCKGVGITKGEVCSKCWGVGILDWITNAMNKERIFFGTSSSSSVQGTSGFSLSHIQNIATSSKGHRTTCTGPR